MSRKLDIAGTIALAATFAFALLSTDGSAAAAKARMIHVPQQADTAIDAPLATPALSSDASKLDDAAITAPSDEVSAESLAQLVAAKTTSAPLSRELNCLAGAIYFEAKSEPLVGQLAVGRVIVNRSRSGRFPDSYCGVVYQPSQFSFVRGNGMPAIQHDSRGWKNAVAIAQIAHEGTWQSPTEGALYFHSAHVSPNWRMSKVAKIGNHVFYR